MQEYRRRARGTVHLRVPAFLCSGVGVSCVIAGFALLSACSHSRPASTSPPHPPQITGTLVVDGLTASVTVVRDRWGVPHITASNTDDLFLAQGFVQAQDRLFQMDLWRRASQGRLSETLGANFIERDAMTRRVQFRGSLDREWDSYGADTHRVAVAFTRGINAWVSRARTDLPEEFVLAGWAPEFWRPEDLLNRTDAFLASTGAQDELFRARLVAAIGASKVDRLLPRPDGRPTPVSPDVDLAAITYVVPQTLRRIGTPPFFSALAAPVTAVPRASQQEETVRLTPDATTKPDTAKPGAAPAGGNPTSATSARARIRTDPPAVSGGNAWVVGPARSATGGALLAVDPHRRFDNPSLRYLVHLTAPGWNVAGATAPWLPGVAIGHNDRIAWGMTPSDIDTEDIFVERINPDDPHQVERAGRWVDMTVDHERLDVKGRATPFEYERLYTAHGVVIALDRERHLAYTLRWSGTEPGGAAELAALALDRADSWNSFSQALTRWNVPATFVYADTSGHLARQTAGKVPQRIGWDGSMPSAGWTEARTWRGWLDAGALPGTLDPPDQIVIAATGTPVRTARITEVLASSGRRTLEDMRRLQLDIVAGNASRLLPLLAAVRDLPPALITARQRLLAWDRRVDAASFEAALYVAWEQALAKLLADRQVSSEFAAELAARIDVASLVTKPSSDWFDDDAVRSRDGGSEDPTRLLVDALRSAVGSVPDERETSRRAQSRMETTFVHPLAVFEPAQRRFNVGPFAQAGYANTVLAGDGRSGPALRAIFDVANWDRSLVINAPGQSGSPASPHYDDLARLWADDDYIPLAFSTRAVAGVAQDTLTLKPR